MIAVLALLVLIGLPILALTIFLIRRKRWGVLFGGMAATGCALLFLWFIPMRVQEMNRQQASVTAVVTSPPRPPQPVSNAELLTLAAAAPRIELEDQAEVEAEPEEANEDDEITLEPPTEPQPEWMTADLQENQQRFTSGPYTTREQCDTDARLRLGGWAWKQARLKLPDLDAEPPAPWLWLGEMPEITERLGVESHLEKRQTSVGEVYLLHTLAQIDDEDCVWIENKVEKWVREGRRSTGIRAVTLIGGLAVGLLGWSHLLLRGGKRTSKEDA